MNVYHLNYECDGLNIHLCTENTGNITDIPTMLWVSGIIHSALSFNIKYGALKTSVGPSSSLPSFEQTVFLVIKTCSVPSNNICCVQWKNLELLPKSQTRESCRDLVLNFLRVKF